MKDLRLPVLALFLWGVALCVIHLPALAPLLGWGGVIAAAMLVLVGVTRLIRVNGLVVLALLCTAALGGVVTAAQPARAELATSDGRAVEAVLEVTSSATRGADGRLWFDAQTHSLGPPGTGRRVRAPVRVGVAETEGIEPGALLRVSGEGAATGPSERAELVIFGTRVQVQEPACGVFAIAAETRRVFSARAMRLPEPGAGLLPGLAVGDTRGVSEELNAAMLASGLSHLTAVSGANCMIVVAAVFWLVSMLGGGRGLRIVLALSALAAFVVLVTPEPSVVRAAVMAALAMLSALLGRPSAGLAMLSLAVCVLLLADPWFAASPGFALSAAATAALLVLSRPLLRGLGRWLPTPLALALSVPLAAQLVCGPIIALFSPQQSLVGVAANLIAAPAAPLATVLGLLACLSAPLVPVADLFAAAAWLPAAWIDRTATVLSALPLATVQVPAGVLAALIVGILSAALVVILARAGPSWMRRSAAGVLLLAVALGGARMLLTGPLSPLTTPEDWTIAVCDIGQGDAILIRSEGRTALVDTGPDPAALRDCLTATGVGHIDLLVLTHFDHDHVGGTAAVEGHVGTVLHGPVTATDERRLLDGLSAGGTRVVSASAGVHGTLGGARWKVLWPDADPVVFPSGNDASVVLEVAGGGVPRTLLLGDTSAASQRLLLRSGRLHGDFPVVKVAHHGSKDQEPALYRGTHAVAALISVGEGNDYGHPRAETVNFLQAAGARVLRTDQRGLILLGIRNGALHVWATRDPP